MNQNTELLAEFDQAMHEIYDRALSEAGYRAKTYRTMLFELGALETARRLILSPQTPEGYLKLWEKGRLDLTLEALIYENPKWQILFTSDELTKLKNRLIKYEYFKE